MTSSTTTRTATVDPAALRAELATNPDTLLVDVRTPAEYQAAHIDGAINLPLDQVDAHLRRIVADAGGRMVLVCQAGGRAVTAAGMLTGAGMSDVAVLDGGMNAWVAAGAPVARAETRTWALERQVRLVAGSMIAASVAASVRFPRLRFLAGAIGAGLATAAVTDSCLLGTLLMKLPYNRRGEVDVEQAIARMRS